MTREEAIEYIKYCMCEGRLVGNTKPIIDEKWQAGVMAIEALKQTCWIPASERLPEYMVSVLTWDGNTFCVEKRIPCIRDNDGEIIESDWWVSDDYDESDSEYYPNLRDGCCIAWMPLPDPYEKESENEE